jgi:hypothetical protein
MEKAVCANNVDDLSKCGKVLEGKRMSEDINIKHLTWKEFKEGLEKLGVTDDTEIDYFDFTAYAFTTMEDLNIENLDATQPQGILMFEFGECNEENLKEYIVVKDAKKSLSMSKN